MKIISGFCTQKNCPRKIRDKEQSDVNEFWECHLEKVSSGGSKVRGDNCDTRLKNTNRFSVKKITSASPVVYRDALRDGMFACDYRRPVTLKKALIDIRNRDELNEGVLAEKDTIERFIRDLQANKRIKKILQRKVIKLAGYGSSAAAFETADGKIIKITDGNHIPMNRPLSCFDVPVFKQGKSGRTHFYLEEKLYQHQMPQYWVDTVRDMIKNQGFKPFDLYDCDTHQIGISAKGRIYLLDPECARYKTIFHAIFDKAKRFILKRI